VQPYALFFEGENPVNIGRFPKEQLKNMEAEKILLSKTHGGYVNKVAH
jgi:hypothetical protein